MKLLNNLIDGVLPMPADLAEALRAGTVRISRKQTGEVAYSVAAHCKNKDAVKLAIVKRGEWETAATAATWCLACGALVGVAHLLAR
ncbi:hypothetical protein PQR33_36140 [Paraburkholderia sediminicola]|uniref:hypothetical protein n=1 Tax=Paraburkholderia sediminicola TaxID=458836 RepID=UPI0038B9EE02